MIVELGTDFYSDYRMSWNEVEGCPKRERRYEEQERRMIVRIAASRLIEATEGMSHYDNVTCLKTKKKYTGREYYVRKKANKASSI